MHPRTPSSVSLRWSGDLSNVSRRQGSAQLGTPTGRRPFGRTDRDVPDERTDSNVINKLQNMAFITIEIPIILAQFHVRPSWSDGSFPCQDRILQRY